ncbi:hypothetical protein JF66_11115 [Cryobacterium sp. MLB-32]|nr:hypothetical protein JF66_11115 [Cryobacterium sp. MLB-32]
MRWSTTARPDETAPTIQVHWLMANTVILRQGLEQTAEAPLLYLLFGEHSALLLDTGDHASRGDFPLRSTVDGLVERWLLEHPRAGYELVVAHTHAHGDHVAGDGQFIHRDATRIVGHGAAAVASFFGLHEWPRGTAEFDLGARVLQMIPTPGHHPSAVTVYDPATRILLTGDTVYPGRLYVDDFPAFESSLSALCDFAAAHPVTAVLGAHIEMTARPGRDFPRGSTRHPNEAPLTLSVADLRHVRDAAARVARRPGAHRFSNFIIWNGPCRREAALQRIRLQFSRLFGR